MEPQRGSTSEIDLVDIWLLIRRHMWLFVGVFAASLIVGVIVAEFIPVKYTYSLAVNVGAMRNEVTGELEPVLSADAETNTLQNSIIPAVLQAYSVKYPNANLPHSDVVANATRDGMLVTLRVNGTLGQATALNAVLEAIAAQLSAEQDGVVKDRIASTKELLGRQIADISSKLDDVKKSYQQLVAHGSQTDKAFTLLLLDNQITQLQQTMFKLQQKLNVNLQADLKITQPVGSPQRSVQPTSVHRSAVFGVVFIVALALGLFAVFISNLNKAAKLRRDSRD